MWKAKASEKLGLVNTRERAAMEYREKLRERWSMDEGVDKVLRFALLILDPLLHNCSPSHKDEASPEAGLSGCKIEANDAGSQESEGGAEEEAFESGRDQTKGGEEEGRSGRADIGLLFLIK
jgi:hypothetical protein